MIQLIFENKMAGYKSIYKDKRNRKKKEENINEKIN